MAEFRLLSRAGCHLCEEFEQALAAELPQIAARLEVLDIDQYPEWQARFGRRIPVLINRNGAVLCEGIFDAQRVTGNL